jgi:hypothetical protein
MGVRADPGSARMSNWIRDTPRQRQFFRLFFRLDRKYSMHHTF